MKLPQGPQSLPTCAQDPPREATGGHGRPREATGGHGRPREATGGQFTNPISSVASTQKPRKATGGRGRPREATGGHGRPRGASLQTLSFFQFSCFNTETACFKSKGYRFLLFLANPFLQTLSVASTQGPRKATSKAMDWHFFSCFKAKAIDQHKAKAGLAWLG